MKVVLIRNYETDRRVYLKGQELEVTPMKYRELLKEKYIKVPKIETAMINEEKEIL